MFLLCCPEIWEIIHISEMLKLEKRYSNFFNFSYMYAIKKITTKKNIPNFPFHSSVPTVSVHEPIQRNSTYGQTVVRYIYYTTLPKHPHSQTHMSTTTPRDKFHVPVTWNPAYTQPKYMISLHVHYCNLCRYHNHYDHRHCVTNLSIEILFIWNKRLHQHRHFCAALPSRFKSPFQIWLGFPNFIWLHLHIYY